jgi:hypothetical protein
VKRERAQHGGIDCAEHGGRSTDAESEHAHHGDREATTLSEPADGVSEILCELVDATESPHVATPFLDGGLVTETPARGEARLVRVEPGAAHGVFAELQVQPHLVGQLGGRAIAAQEICEASEELSEHGAPWGGARDGWSAWGGLT